MKLLVIIVTYNAMKWAKRCFDSLQTSSVVPDVFVVDNGSTDGTQTFVQNNYPEVIFQQSEKNLGFGAANNIGLKYALENDYDYVYLLNQDAWVMCDTFEKLIKICMDNPEFGLISPMQMNADLYHIDNIFCKGLFDYRNKEVISDLYNNNLKNIYETTPFAMAAHWFLTRKCIEKVGGFSPTFQHYGEDCNYTDRVVFHGIKIGTTPLLKVVHDRGERVDTSKKMMYQYYMSFKVMLSNPLNENIFMSFVKISLNCTKLVFKFRSLKPIFYFWKTVFNVPKISKNKKMSMNKECAFLV